MNHHTFRLLSLTILLLSGVPHPLQAIALVANRISLQDDTAKKEVEIINADVLHFSEINGQKHTILTGNVALKQDEVLMYCDSADLNKEENSMEAWGRVHIQNDTIDAYSDHLIYKSGERLMTLQRRASISDGKAKIVSDELFYNTRDKLAYYNNWGKVYREKSVIVSRVATYFTKQSEVYFLDQVTITDPEYRLTSDSLMYNTSTDICTFFRNTTIFNKKSRINCNTGSFDTKNNQAVFGKDTRLFDDKQVLYADSLFFDRKKNYGRAMVHFHWIDSTMDFELFGRDGEYFEKRDQMKAWNNAYLVYKMEKDSLFLTGDTLRTQTESETDSTRVFFAYHHMRMYMRNMQGACDSLKYSFRDSTFNMYYSPILWADTTQMTADTILLTVKNKKADHLSLLTSGFVIAPSGKKFFDQIKGKNIYGYFVNNELDRLFVDGNAESLYFGKDERGKYQGVNKSLSVTMWLYFRNRKITKINFIQKPEAVFTPMKLTAPDDYQLKNFNWQITRRPQSREEIMGIQGTRKEKL
ncbi:MAG: OstA-like protein [Chitinophagales bacterium]